MTLATTPARPPSRMRGLALTLALCLGATASIPSALAREATVRLLADRAPEDAAEVVLVAGDKRSAAMPLPLNAPSAAVPAPARAFEVRAAGGDGDSPLAKIALPDAGNAFLVLLLAAEKGKGFQPVVLAADGKSFKPGDLYFHNSSATRTITGKVGTADLTLAPGKGIVITPAATPPDKLYAVSLKVRDDQRERVLTETSWPLDPTLRTYVFFYDKPGTDRVEYRAVEEFVEPAAKP